MKKLLLILFSLSYLTAWGFCAGGEKVVESSDRHAPKWIYGMEKDYIIVSAQAATIEDARDKAMLQVKKEILSSIAERVKSESHLTNEELSKDGSYQTLTRYVEQINTKSSNIPMLQEVSVAKAEAYYWEKLKRDKQYFYRYHIKYPFSKLELYRMVDNFQMQEAQLDSQLESFRTDNFTSYTTVEAMVQRISDLKIYESGLQEDDERRNICKSIMTAYNKYILEITLRQIDADRDQLTFAPYFGERRLTTNMIPKLRSNCLTALQYSTVGGECRVTYDYNAGCYPDEQNWLEVTLTVSGKKIKNTFYIK